MITENLSTLKIHKLTQAQYNRELENGNIDKSALYLTPDEGDYYTKSEIDEKLEVVDDKIDTPITAETGQTIVVKSVDENGKPTEWGAEDFPISSGWELLTDMTTTEDATVVQIDTCDDGTPIVQKGLCAIFVDVTTAANPSLTDYKTLYYNINNWTAAQYYGEIPNGLYKTKREAFCLCMLTGSRAIYSCRHSGFATQKLGHANNEQKQPYITGFRVWSSASETPVIPAGSNFKVYGVKL